MELEVKLFLFNTLYMVVTGFVYPSIPLYLRMAGVDEVGVGVSLSVISLAGFVSQLLWGYLSDLTGERRKLVLGGGVSAAAVYALLALPWSLPVLVALLVLASILSAPVMPLVMAAASERGERVGRAMGLFWAGGSLGWALATACSGYILDNYGVQLIFTIASAVLLASAVIAASVTSRAPAKAAKAAAGGRARPSAALLALLACVLVFMVVDVVKNTYVPMFYAFGLGLGATLATLSLSLASWLEIPSILFFSYLSDRVNKWYIFGLSLLLGAVYMAINASASSALHAAAAMGFYSLVWGSFSVSTSALVAEVSGEARGTAYGAYNALFPLANILVPPVVGYVVSLTGYRAAFAFVALCSACAGLVTLALGTLARKRRMESRVEGRHVEGLS